MDSAFKVILCLGLSLSLAACCPDGWIQHGFSCYFFSMDAEHWVGAMDVCVTFGGNLVEIETAEEDKYLSAQTKLRRGTYWIGLTDLVQEGEWQWMTSKDLIGPSGFSNWAAGKPENGTNTVNCANYISNVRHWDDAECYQSYYFICERPADATSVVG